MGLILLVEDDPDVTAAFVIFLGALGHEVLTAATLAAARTVLAARTPHLLIADEGLTDGRGSELLAWAAVMLPTVPRILLTAARATDAGPLPPGTLVRYKPWDIDEAERTLDSLLASGAGSAP